MAEEKPPFEEAPQETIEADTNESIVPEDESVIPTRAHTPSMDITGDFDIDDIEFDETIEPEPSTAAAPPPPEPEVEEHEDEIFIADEDDVIPPPIAPQEVAGVEEHEDEIFIADEDEDDWDDDEFIPPPVAPQETDEETSTPAPEIEEELDDIGLFDDDDWLEEDNQVLEKREPIIADDVPAPPPPLNNITDEDAFEQPFEQEQQPYIPPSPEENPFNQAPPAAPLPPPQSAETTYAVPEPQAQQQLMEEPQEEDEDDNINYMQQDQQFEVQTSSYNMNVSPEEIVFTYEDLVNFIGDERSAQYALSYGKQAVAAGASIPKKISVQRALAASPDMETAISQDIHRGR